MNEAPKPKKNQPKAQYHEPTLVKREKLAEVTEGLTARVTGGGGDQELIG